MQKLHNHFTLPKAISVKKVSVVLIISCVLFIYYGITHKPLRVGSTYDEKTQENGIVIATELSQNDLGTIDSIDSKNLNIQESFEPSLETTFVLPNQQTSINEEIVELGPNKNNTIPPEDEVTQTYYDDAMQIDGISINSPEGDLNTRITKSSSQIPSEPILNNKGPEEDSIVE